MSCNESTKEHFKEGWVDVDNIPTHVMTWGKWIEDENEEKITVFEDTRKPILLFFCGNPGITMFYSFFLSVLFEKLRLPIWLISHAGHERPPKKYINKFSKSNISKIYLTQDQVQHKAAFIEKYLPADRKLFLLGHSFGAKVIVDLLKKESLCEKVDKCYLMFPTLEHIAKTPNAKFVVFVYNYIFSLLVFLSMIFSMFFYHLKWFLIKSYLYISGWRNITPNCMEAVIQLIQPSIIRNIFYLTNNEMKVITDLDKEVYEKCTDKFRMFFGADDGWAPARIHDNLIKIVPEIDSRIIDPKYEHCFVLSTPVEFATELACYIKKDL